MRGWEIMVKPLSLDPSSILSQKASVTSVHHGEDPPPPPYCCMQFFLICNFWSHDNQIAYWVCFERKGKQNHHQSPPKKNICISPSSWGRVYLQTANLWASNTPNYQGREWKQSAQVGIARELSVNSIHHLLWKMAVWMNTLSQERKGQGNR